MKLFVIFLFYIGILFPQNLGWQSIKATTVPIQNLLENNAVSNSFGCFMALHYVNGNLKVVKIDVNTGGVIQTLYEAYAVTPGVKIVTDGNDLYLTYNKDGVFSVIKSIDGGVNWFFYGRYSSSIADYTLTVVGGLIYIVHQVGTRIWFLYHNGTDFIRNNRISQDEYTTGPKIQYDQPGNKIYALYNYNIGIKQRVLDCSTMTWGSESILLSGYSYPLLTGFALDAIGTSIYFNYSNGEYNVFSMLYYNRFSGQGELKFYEIGNSTFYTPNVRDADNNNHTVYFYMGGGFPPPFEGYSSFGFEDGQVTSGLVDEYSDPIPYPRIIRENVFVTYNYYFINNLAFAVSGNNRYYFWSKPNESILYLRAYNGLPLTPSNLSISAYQNHPKIKWDRNPDADIVSYSVFKRTYGEGYSQFATLPGSVTEYVDIYETVVTGPSVQNESVVYYKVVATDYSNLTSGYSNEVNSRINGPVPNVPNNGLYKNRPSNYSLDINYPNPFNPTTSIRYQIPNAGDVKLVVYDVLGKEVATLVNKEQAPGSYTVTFDGSKLASGVYIYKLTAGNYTATKKLNLLK